LKGTAVNVFQHTQLPFGTFFIQPAGKVSNIVLEVWLYGALASYGGEAKKGSFANLKMSLPEGSTMADLLAHLGIRTEERGITSIPPHPLFLPACRQAGRGERGD
jgi:hypothetical protein